MRKYGSDVFLLGPMDSVSQVFPAAALECVLVSVLHPLKISIQHDIHDVCLIGRVVTTRILSLIMRFLSVSSNMVIVLLKV